MFVIWRDAVRATHGFLTPADFDHFAAMVRGRLASRPDLDVIDGPDGEAAGFMLREGERIEALFVDPALHGRGIGRALIDHAKAGAAVLALDVNEQGGALGFYRRMGFVPVGRSPTDDSGRPYPLIHMRWRRTGSLPPAA